MAFFERIRQFSIKQVIGIFLLLIIFVVLLRSLYGLYYRYEESALEMEKTEATITALESRQNELRKNIEELSTVRGREQEIRTRFNVAKNGEALVVIVDDTATETATSTPAKTLWQTVGDWFGSIF